MKGAIEESHWVKHSKKGKSYKFRLWGGVRKQENRSVEHLLGYYCLAHCYPSQIANTEITTQVKDYIANQNYSPTATKGTALMTKKSKGKIITNYNSLYQY